MTISESSNYIIDAENIVEMARLIRQSRVLTTLTGLLPPDCKLTGQAHVLDVACGPGEWLLKLAEEQSQLSVTGIDLSPSMTNYANMLAREKELHNVHLKVMDITQPLAFPDATFDLVHTRYLAYLLAPAQWSPLLAELHRILKPGGKLVNVECEGNGVSTSRSINKIVGLFQLAMHKAGRCFAPDSESHGITAVLPSLLCKSGFTDTQRDAFVLDGSYGAEAHEELVHDFAIAYQLLIPFLTQLGVAKEEELTVLRLRAIEEMRSPDFSGILYIHRIWASKPGEN